MGQFISRHLEPGLVKLTRLRFVLGFFFPDYGAYHYMSIICICLLYVSYVFLA